MRHNLLENEDCFSRLLLMGMTFCTLLVWRMNPLCFSMNGDSQIRDALTKRANDFGLILEDVALTHLSFSKEYAKAIEQKQVAHQEAERAKFVVQKSDEERKAAVIRAEGESEAAKLISEATKSTGPALLELRRIEVCFFFSSFYTICMIMWAQWDLPPCSLPFSLFPFSHLQAAKEIAQTMSRSRNVVYLPSQGNMLMGINAGQGQQQ